MRNFVSHSLSKHSRLVKINTRICLLLPDRKYTALIPFDEAFQRWYPIDWGFNPFLVRPFVRQTLLDHFLVGDVGEQDDVRDGDTFRSDTMYCIPFGDCNPRSRRDFESYERITNLRKKYDIYVVF